MIGASGRILQSEVRYWSSKELSTDNTEGLIDNEYADRNSWSVIAF